MGKICPAKFHLEIKCILFIINNNIYNIEVYIYYWGMFEDPMSSEKETLFQTSNEYSVAATVAL